MFVHLLSVLFFSGLWFKHGRETNVLCEKKNQNNILIIKLDDNLLKYIFHSIDRSQFGKKAESEVQYQLLSFLDL